MGGGRPSPRRRSAPGTPRKRRLNVRRREAEKGRGSPHRLSLRGAQGVRPPPPLVARPGPEAPQARPPLPLEVTLARGSSRGPPPPAFPEPSRGGTQPRGLGGGPYTLHPRPLLFRGKPLGSRSISTESPPPKPLSVPRQYTPSPPSLL